MTRSHVVERLEWMVSPSPTEYAKQAGMQSHHLAGDPALISATVWIKAVALGSTASLLAVLAMAVVGLSMLSGRLPLRRGLTVLVGCFILSSAATIADGLTNRMPHDEALEPIIAAPTASYTPTAPRQIGNDPYAGAAIPVQ